MKLVFDVGGTAVKYGVSDEEGNFSFTDSVPTPKTDVKEFLKVTGDIFEKAVREYALDGLAFSFPGEVHSREGVIKGISAVEYLHHIPLKTILEERFGGLPVTMANDANCAALGERWKGISKCCVCDLRNRYRGSGDRTGNAGQGSDHEPGRIRELSHGRLSGRRPSFLE